MNRFVEEFKPQRTNIAICGSMAHKDLWLPIIDQLRTNGLTVSTPELSEARDWSKFTDDRILLEKGALIRRHFANIATADAVLIANFEKNGIENYVGSNTFLEMCAGFIYDKPIYLLNPVPKQDNYEEILALEPIVLNGDLSQLEQFK